MIKTRAKFNHFYGNGNKYAGSGRETHYEIWNAGVRAVLDSFPTEAEVEEMGHREESYFAIRGAKWAMKIIRERLKDLQ